MSRNPFAILADPENPYPKQASAVPEKREKVVREKDRHEPGTGRRDTTKRDGKGAYNVGNPIEDVRKGQLDDGDKPEQEQPVEEKPEEPKEPKIVYVAATNFFSDSEDDEIQVQPKMSKSEAKVDSKYFDMIAKKPDRKVSKRSEEDQEEFQIQFLSTKEALKEQAEREQSKFNKRFNHPKGPKRNYYKPAQKEGQEAKPEEKTEQPRGPKNPGSYDKKPQHVPHQRTNNNYRPKGGNLKMDNFPSLSK